MRPRRTFHLMIGTFLLFFTLGATVTHAQALQRPTTELNQSIDKQQLPEVRSRTLTQWIMEHWHENGSDKQPSQSHGKPFSRRDQGRGPETSDRSHNPTEAWTPGPSSAPGTTVSTQKTSNTSAFAGESAPAMTTGPATSEPELDNNSSATPSSVEDIFQGSSPSPEQTTSKLDIGTNGISGDNLSLSVPESSSADTFFIPVHNPLDEERGRPEVSVLSNPYGQSVKIEIFPPEQSVIEPGETVHYEVKYEKQQELKSTRGPIKLGLRFPDNPDHVQTVDLSVQTSAGADLAVYAQQIQFIPERPGPGTPVKIRAVFRNMGRASRSDVPVTLSLDDRSLVSRSIDLESGETETVTVQAVANVENPTAGGAKLLRAKINSEGVEENNQFNNRASKVLIVQGEIPFSSEFKIMVRGELNKNIVSPGATLKWAGQARYSFDRSQEAKGSQVLYWLTDREGNVLWRTLGGWTDREGRVDGFPFEAPDRPGQYSLHVRVFDGTLKGEETFDFEVTPGQTASCPGTMGLWGNVESRIGESLDDVYFLAHGLEEGDELAGPVRVWVESKGTYESPYSSLTTNLNESDTEQHYFGRENERVWLDGLTVPEGQSIKINAEVRTKKGCELSASRSVKTRPPAWLRVDAPSSVTYSDYFDIEVEAGIHGAKDSLESPVTVKIWDGMSDTVTRQFPVRTGAVFFHLLSEQAPDTTTTYRVTAQINTQNGYQITEKQKIRVLPSDPTSSRQSVCSGRFKPTIRTSFQRPESGVWWDIKRTKGSERGLWDIPIEITPGYAVDELSGEIEVRAIQKTKGTVKTFTFEPGEGEKDKMVRTLEDVPIVSVIGNNRDQWYLRVKAEMESPEYKCNPTSDIKAPWCGIVNRAFFFFGIAPHKIVSTGSDYHVKWSLHDSVHSSNSVDTFKVVKTNGLGEREVLDFSDRIQNRWCDLGDPGWWNCGPTDERKVLFEAPDTPTTVRFTFKMTSLMGNHIERHESVRVIPNHGRAKVESSQTLVPGETFDANLALDLAHPINTGERFPPDRAFFEDVVVYPWPTYSDYLESKNLIEKWDTGSIRGPITATVDNGVDSPTTRTFSDPISRVRHWSDTISNVPIPENTSEVTVSLSGHGGGAPLRTSRVFDVQPHMSLDFLGQEFMSLFQDQVRYLDPPRSVGTNDEIKLGFRLRTNRETETIEDPVSITVSDTRGYQRNFSVDPGEKSSEFTHHFEDLKSPGYPTRLTVEVQSWTNNGYSDRWKHQIKVRDTRGDGHDADTDSRDGTCVNCHLTHFDHQTPIHPGESFDLRILLESYEANRNLRGPVTVVFNPSDREPDTRQFDPDNSENYLFKQDFTDLRAPDETGKFTIDLIGRFNEGCTVTSHHVINIVKERSFDDTWEESDRVATGGYSWGGYPDYSWPGWDYNHTYSPWTRSPVDGDSGPPELDLEIHSTDIQFSNNRPIEGRELKFFATVHNNSNLIPAKRVKVEFYDEEPGHQRGKSLGVDYLTIPSATKWFESASAVASISASINNDHGTSTADGQKRAHAIHAEVTAVKGVDPDPSNNLASRTMLVRNAGSNYTGGTGDDKKYSVDVGRLDRPERDRTTIKGDNKENKVDLVLEPTRDGDIIKPGNKSTDVFLEVYNRHEPYSVQPIWTYTPISDGNPQLDSYFSGDEYKKQVSFNGDSDKKLRAVLMVEDQIVATDTFLVDVELYGQTVSPDNNSENIEWSSSSVSNSTLSVAGGSGEGGQSGVFPVASSEETDTGISWHYFSQESASPRTIELDMDKSLKLTREDGNRIQVSQGELTFHVNPLLYEHLNLVDAYPVGTPRNKVSQVMFVKDSKGLNIQFVHDTGREYDGSGGEAHFRFSGMPSGKWVVKDDPYRKGYPKTSEFLSYPDTVKWVWGQCCTDGGVYRGEFEDPFRTTVDPETFKYGINQWNFVVGASRIATLPRKNAVIDQGLNSVRVYIHDPFGIDYERTRVEIIDRQTGSVRWSTDQANATLERGGEHEIIVDLNSAIDEQGKFAIKTTFTNKRGQTLVDVSEFEIDTEKENTKSDGPGPGAVEIIKPTDDGHRMTNNEMTVVVDAPNHHEIALQVATGKNGFETINRTTAEPSRDDRYRFEHVSIAPGADSFAIRARGFDDTNDPTYYSQIITFKRETLAGVSLRNRPGVDGELSQAVAADPGFGIVSFGKESSSDNPSFDPSKGESLRIIPPVSSSASMKIFTVSGESVKEIQGPPGQDIEWFGKNRGGVTVNNGAYIVKVKSGGRTKSFPVMVVK